MASGVISTEQFSFYPAVSGQEMPPKPLAASQSAIHSEAIGATKARAAKVCILNESDARLFTYAGIEHKCSSRRHHHYSRNKVDTMVRAGELVWLGKHRKIAAFRNARSWMKVYRRNAYGETLSCNMQLVRGGGGH